MQGRGGKAGAPESLFLSHLAGSQRRIEETYPLSTDLTVIPCSHSAKSKWNAFTHSCPLLER